MTQFSVKGKYNFNFSEIVYGNTVLKAKEYFISIEILGRSLDNKNKVINLEEQKDKSIWSKIFPFKCVKD